MPDLAGRLKAGPPGKSRDTTDVNSDHEWLAALLARDAEELSESQSSSRWTRRIATWGTACVVLVLLAAGGLWLYQESRVEGALVVVASTSPAPAATLARPSLTATAPALPASPNMAAATRETPAPAAALPSNAEPDQPVQQAEAVPAPKPRRSAVRRHPKAETRADIPADREPSARQRHEETLMQCRAHGYDERQCVQRGCEMTRFGFACKG